MENQQIIGTLGKNAEVKQVNNDYVMTLSVACNRSSGDKQKTVWYKVTKWYKESAPKVADWLKKGAIVYASGLPEIEMYEDKSGKFNTKPVIFADKIDIIKFAEKPATTEVTPVNEPVNNKVEETDDLPF